ncbi:MAG: hypothetical protein ACRERD_04895 [Candidatus Binatia bacterium]
MTDKHAEQLKEQIQYETEVFRATLLIAVATIGGTIGLLLGEPSRLRAVLVGAGLLVTLIAAFGVWRQDRTIRALIAQVEEDLHERL